MVMIMCIVTSVPSVQHIIREMLSKRGQRFASIGLLLDQFSHDVHINIIVLSIEVLTNKAKC